MAEKSDAERVRELEARVAELEKARAEAPDLEWLRNSHFWKRTEYWAHPRWNKVGALFALLVVGFVVFSEWTQYKPRPHSKETGHEQAGWVSTRYVNGDKITSSPAADTPHEGDY